MLCCNRPKNTECLTGHSVERSRLGSKSSQSLWGISAHQNFHGLNRKYFGFDRKYQSTDEDVDSYQNIEEQTLPGSMSLLNGFEKIDGSHVIAGNSGLVDHETLAKAAFMDFQHPQQIATAMHPAYSSSLRRGYSSMHQPYPAMSMQHIPDSVFGTQSPHRGSLAYPFNVNPSAICNNGGYVSGNAHHPFSMTSYGPPPSSPLTDGE